MIFDILVCLAIIVIAKFVVWLVVLIVATLEYAIRKGE